jgi:hypothetical protein
MRNLTDMNLYVAEISGRAIAAMNAENTFIADDWFGGPGFHSELLRIRDEDGNPLWDGEAEIRVRPASSEEQKIWERARAEAVVDGDVDEDEDRVLVFLIPVIDEDPDEIDG